MNIKKNRHSVFDLSYHLVVVTKYRHKCINENVMNDLKDIAKNIFENSWDCEIIEIDWEEDHLHILFSAPPQVQLSKLVNNFKTVSSRLIRKKYLDYLSKYFWKPCFWWASYGIFSTGWATLEVVKKYVQNQNSPSWISSSGTNSSSPKS